MGDRRQDTILEALAMLLSDPGSSSPMAYSSHYSNTLLEHLLLLFCLLFFLLHSGFLGWLPKHTPGNISCLRLLRWGANLINASSEHRAHKIQNRQCIISSRWVCVYIYLYIYLSIFIYIYIYISILLNSIITKLFQICLHLLGLGK